MTRKRKKRGIVSKFIHDVNKKMGSLTKKI